MPNINTSPLFRQIAEPFIASCADSMAGRTHSSGQWSHRLFAFFLAGKQMKHGLRLANAKADPLYPVAHTLYTHTLVVIT